MEALVPFIYSIMQNITYWKHMEYLPKNNLP